MNLSLVDSKKVLLSPLNIKLGLITINQNGRGFFYIKETFLRIRKAKIKEAWGAFKRIVNFLGNARDDNYEDLVCL